MEKTVPKVIPKSAVAAANSGFLVSLTVIKAKEKPKTSFEKASIRLETAGGIILVIPSKYPLYDAKTQ